MFFALLFLILMSGCPGVAVKAPIAGVSRPNYGVDFNFLYPINNMHGSWKHVWTVDISILHRKINLDAQLKCDVVDPICDPSKEFLNNVLPRITNMTEWFSDHFSWLEDPSILSTINRQDRDGKRRKKRALLPFIGDIEKFFFGVATESDLAALKSMLEDMQTLHGKEIKDVSNLGENLASVTKMLQDQVGNSAQGFKQVKASFENLTSQVNARFHDLVRDLTDQNHVVKYNSLGIVHLMSMLEQLLPAMVDGVKISLADLQMLSAIQFTLLGYLPFTFVPPNELARGLEVALQGIRQQFPAAQLTHPPSALGYYYTHKIVTPYLSGNTISLIVDIPIDLKQEILYVYAIRTFPVSLLPYNPYTRTVDPLSKAGTAQSILNLRHTHFLITDTGDAWTAANDNELSTCKGDTIRACRTQFPLYKSINKHCLERLWTNSEFQSILDACPYQLAHPGSHSSLAFDVQVIPLSNGKWYIESPLDDHWKITCPSRPPETRSPCTSCVIQVDCGCGVEGPYFKIPTRVSSCDSVFSPLHRNFTVNPFNYLPKNQPWVINLTGDESFNHPPKFQPDITLPDGGTWDDVLEPMDSRILDLNKLYELQKNETQSFRTEAEALLKKIKEQDKILASLSGWPDWILGFAITLTFVNSGVIGLICFCFFSRVRAIPISDELNLIEKEEMGILGMEAVQLILSVMIFICVLVLAWPIIGSWTRNNKVYRRIRGYSVSVKATGYRALRHHHRILCQGVFRFHPADSTIDRLIPAQITLGSIPFGSHMNTTPTALTAPVKLAGAIYECKFASPIIVLLPSESHHICEDFSFPHDYIHRKFNVPLSSPLIEIGNCRLWVEP